MRGLVKVDAETFELQASGLCAVAVNPNSTESSIVTSLIDNRWAGNVATAEVCASCLPQQGHRGAAAGGGSAA